MSYDDSLFIEELDPLENESDLAHNLVSSLSSTVTQASDWTISTMIDLIKRNKILLNPEFQRRDAWQTDRKTKFIESILLGFPIPQIVLAESKSERGRYIVIDGKQRLLALVSAAGIQGEDNILNVSPLRLNGFEILSDFNRKTLKKIQETEFYRQNLDDFDTRTIRTVVIRNWANEDILYHIFLRLNTGSVQLSAQELRNALHPGPFAEFIDTKSTESRGIKRMLNITKPDFRMRDAELLLRYYAFATSIDNYNGSMKQFLDNTTKRMNIVWANDSEYIIHLLSQFEEAVELTYEIFNDNAFRKRKKAQFEDRFNRAVFDIMVYYFSQSDIRDAARNKLREIYDAYVDLSDTDPDFINSLESTTKSLPATSYRLSKWGEKLAAILNQPIKIPQLIENRIVIR